MTPANDHGQTTTLQKARWSSKGFTAADMLDDCPLCFFTAVGLLAVCVVVGLFVLIGVI
jgi:hypothetical protein